MKCPHCGKQIKGALMAHVAGSKGGKSRVSKLTPEQRSEEMRQRAASRWAKYRAEQQPK